ncbi:MAG: CotH kinase family protein [Paludibacteraceae bacterium]|nr:CotH kinase family protein [Paludibacteraceae bacterium]
MKNFTNNFKQFTSRLSARWLIMALMMLVGTSSAWAVDKVIYITTGTSTGYSNPYIYVWNNSSNNSWPGKAMDSAGKTSEGYPVYKYEWTSTINNFIVMDGICGDGCKKTADVSYSQTKNYIYNVKTGKWSSYNPCETPTIAWNDFAENMCVGNQQTLTATASNGAAVTFSSSNTTYASISGTTLTAAKAGSATITASVAASGNYCSATANKTVTISNCIPVGPKVHALGSTTLGADKFAALYVTDCSGKEIDAYQWEYCRTQDGTYQPYSSVCSYTFEKKDVVKTENSDAGKTNNIRPSEFGYYRCKVTYKDGTTATSATEHILGSYSRSFTSNIPVLVVNTGSKGFPDCTGLSGQTASKNASTFKAKRSVDVKIYEGETLVYDRKARMNYRGSSSLNFVKKSYAFCPGDANCEEKDGQADYVKTAKLNMLGVGKACDKDWVLYAAAADPSLMRNRLVFDSYKAMTGKWGVNSRYVELIVDGVYKGVYVFMDKITMNTERVKVDEDKGFIVKFDKTDREDRVGGLNGVLGDEKTFKTSYTGKDDISTYDTSIDQRFEIEYPEKDDYKTGWKARVDGIQGMFQAFEDALKQGDYATVQKYIDYTSWADWFIINEFTKNVDAYRASCIFVYTGEAGAKIEARPLWDQELSFNNQASKGTSDKGCDSTTGLLIQHSNVYSDAFRAPFWFTGEGSDITGGLLSDPCFVQVVKERWNIHQLGALSKKSLEDLVDEYEDDLAPEGTTENALTRETAFWDGKSRGNCDCSYDTGNATATGYQNKTFEDSKTAITNWISDDAASGAKGRRAGLTTAINGLTGASFSIQILPLEVKTTPWEPVEITVSVTPAGYDYKLEYTGDNNLGGVANTIIKEEGDKITYRIPRPSDWGVGDAEEVARADIEYGIKATLSVQEGTTVCGSQAAPSSTGKIILQDEDNDNCK